VRLLVSGRLRGRPKALPKPWVLRHGFFLGPGVNVASADLTGANLSHARLDQSRFSYSNLTNANFSDTNFTGANLSYATTDGADFTNAIWSTTICPDGANSDRSGTRASATSPEKRSVTERKN
jgi:uncharacterized protein YjbI with pentapeptide repeats